MPDDIPNSEFPAFLVPNSEADLTDHDVGLTKRELFAAMAMQGLLANGEKVPDCVDIPDHAVGYADALLAALEQGQDG